MSKRKHKFSPSQRWAIWTGYGMKCFWCKKTLDFDDCEIDNVIPKQTSKIVLGGLIKDYDLGSEFSLNSYRNWVPACISCVKTRAKSAFRPGPALPGWFKLIRSNAPNVEAKVKRIEGEQSAESLLKLLVEKVENGELNPEDVERIVRPFLTQIEGPPKDTVEFRLSETLCFFYSSEGIRLRPISEIRYQKFVEKMVESPEFKKRRSPEEIREGPISG